MREEIALAKAEMTEKVTKLAKGAVFGIVAGVFAVFALIYLLHALSWGHLGAHRRSAATSGSASSSPACVILILGAICGLIAMRLVKSGLAADAADGDRGGAADQGHADRRAGRAHAGPVGARQAPSPAPAEGSADGRRTRTPEEIRRSIEANRAELGIAVDRLRAEVAEVTDWRKQLNRHRKQVLIGAAVAGFVIGGGIAALTGLADRRLAATTRPRLRSGSGVVRRARGGGSCRRAAAPARRAMFSGRRQVRCTR